MVATNAGKVYIYTIRAGGLFRSLCMNLRLFREFIKIPETSNSFSLFKSAFNLFTNSEWRMGNLKELRGSFYISQLFVTCCSWCDLASKKTFYQSINTFANFIIHCFLILIN